MTSSQNAVPSEVIDSVDSVEVRELRGEILALREYQKEQTDTTSELLTELQRRCEQIIDLEVRLDKERERANRLERQQKEDEALSGELRELMANVDTATLPRATDGASPPTEPDAAPQTTAVAAAGRAAGVTPPSEDVAKPLAVEEGKETKGTRSAYGPLQGVGVLLSDWGLGGRGRAQAAGCNSNGETPRDEKLSPESSAEEASGGGGRGGGNRAPSGALRARVVELELQRAEAGELLKAKLEDSIQLQVQVEQLKNVVQSLSHASETSWEREGAREEGSARSGNGASGMVDLGPLLREVPDVDPAFILALHRTPWAEGLCEGIQREETCLEWQGKDSRGNWSSKPSDLPSQLSSLPYSPPQHPPGGKTSPAMPLRQGRAKSASPRDKNTPYFPTTPFLPTATAANRMTRSSSEVAETKRASRGRGERAGVRGFGGRIGEAVAAFGGAVTGWEDGGGVVTDEGVSARFSLGDVQLPSDHWEWVGGWIPDAEGEVCADEDGWIYGSTPAEISEISETAFERRPSGGTAVTARQGPHKGDEEARRNPGDWSLRGPGGKGNAGVDMPVRRGGVKDERSGSGSTDTLGAAVLRRRRLVRLRTVVRLDGARESTKNFLKTMQRVCSLEILVRKLSQQVVSLHRQVTGLEGQVAFLAPLQPKLRQACALGRKDRLRGDVLQRRLIEAENELKVLKRCMGTSAPTPPPRAPPQVSPASRLGSPKSVVPPRASTQERTGVPGDVNSWYIRTSASSGENESEKERKGPWGWVGGVAQRAAGNLSRRSLSYPVAGAAAGEELMEWDGEGADAGKSV